MIRTKISCSNFNFDNFLTSFKYSDSLDNQSDSVEISLSDPSHSLLQRFKPLKGSNSSFQLISYVNNSPIYFNVGSFELDVIKHRFPPTSCTLKFNSLPKRTQIKATSNFNSWENVHLSQIARDISSRAGLSLFFDVDSDPHLDRVQQTEQSDLQLLASLCKNFGFAIKIHNSQLIIFDEAKYERKKPVDIIRYGDNRIISFSGESSLTGIYGDAQVSFLPNGINDWLFGLFANLEVFQSSGGLNLHQSLNFDGNASNNVLNIFEKVDSKADAERLAQKRLRDANKKEWSVNFNLIGSFNLVAGNVIQLANFGIYDGCYLIDRSEHSVDCNGGYSTSISCHKCLPY